MVSYAGCADAFDLTGQWATERDSCSKIFTTIGGKAAIRRNSGLFGSGFVVEANRIIGPDMRCTIKTAKESGPMLHVLASCATDVMLSNVQFSAKIVDDNRITRVFPGIEGMEIDYVRCPPQPAR
jgi:hypothetical protein